MATRLETLARNELPKLGGAFAATWGLEYLYSSQGWHVLDFTVANHVDWANGLFYPLIAYGLLGHVAPAAIAHWRGPKPKSGGGHSDDELRSVYHAGGDDRSYIITGRGSPPSGPLDITRLNGGRTKR